MATRCRPPASDENVRRRMRRTRRRDTDGEVALRSILHRRGLRFRIDEPPLRGVRRRADLVFRPARVAVFVDGCFWHVCPEHATWPKRNAEWWREKLEGNRRRDAETDRALALAGWQSMRVWSHEDAVVAADRVEAAVTSRLGH